MIRQAKKEDVQAILDIVNFNILHSTALYYYKEQTYEQRLAWFEAKQQTTEPLFVFEVDGEVAGYATYGPFRPHDAFGHTVEHSIYVDERFQRRGIARQLMEALIQYAKQAGNVKTMIGCIDAGNAGSIQLHEKLGFTYSGTLKSVGYKFDTWLDLAMYQLYFPVKA